MSLYECTICGEGGIISVIGGEIRYISRRGPIYVYTEPVEHSVEKNQ